MNGKLKIEPATRRIVMDRTFAKFYCDTTSEECIATGNVYVKGIVTENVAVLKQELGELYLRSKPRSMSGMGYQERQLL